MRTDSPAPRRRRDRGDQGAMAVLLAVVLVALLVPLAGYGTTTYIRAGIAGELQRAADAGALAGSSRIPLLSPETLLTYLDRVDDQDLTSPLPDQTVGSDINTLLGVSDADSPLAQACRTALQVLRGDGNSLGNAFARPNSTLPDGDAACTARYRSDAPLLSDLTRCLTTDVVSSGSGPSPLPAPSEVVPTGVVPSGVVPAGGAAAVNGRALLGLPTASPSAIPLPSVSAVSPLPVPSAPPATQSPVPLPSPSEVVSSPSTPSPTPLLPLPVPTASTPVGPVDLAQALRDAVGDPAGILPNFKSLLPVLVKPGIEVRLSWTSRTPLDGFFGGSSQGTEQVRDAYAVRVPKNVVLLPVTTVVFPGVTAPVLPGLPPVQLPTSPLSPVLDPVLATVQQTVAGLTASINDQLQQTVDQLPADQVIDPNTQIKVFTEALDEQGDAVDGLLSDVFDGYLGASGCARLFPDAREDLGFLLNPTGYGAPRTDAVLADAAGSGTDVVLVLVSDLNIPTLDFAPTCLKQLQRAASAPSQAPVQPSASAQASLDARFGDGSLSVNGGAQAQAGAAVDQAVLTGTTSGVGQSAGCTTGARGAFKARLIR